MIVYTIGFTKKTAQEFFGKITCAEIDIIIDIRLNNTSQLSGFAKYPDIQYFLSKLSMCDYVHDVKFAPSEETLKAYKSNNICWEEYVIQFYETMEERNIIEHISKQYTSLQDKNICLLCSEDSYKNCHRSLISAYFERVFNCCVINL